MNGISCRLSLVCALCPCTLCFVIGFSRACLVLKVRFGNSFMANFGGTSQGELSVANPILMLRQSYDCRERQIHVFSIQKNSEHLCVPCHTSNTYRFACLIGPFSLLHLWGSLVIANSSGTSFLRYYIFITKYTKSLQNNNLTIKNISTKYNSYFFTTLDLDLFFSDQLYFSSKLTGDMEYATIALL